MSSHDHRHGSSNDTTSARAGSGGSPGKRTLTQSLPAIQRSLRDQQRPVADFDAGLNDDIPNTRSTIATAVARGPDLTDAQIAKARRRNPHWIKKLKVPAQVFGAAPVDSPAFALEVAAKQAAHALNVDGIAGPRTAAALGATATAARSRPHVDGATVPPGSPRAILDRDGDMIPDAAHADAARAVVDADGDMVPDAGPEDGARAVLDADGDMMPDEPYANDDPFGMHLLAGD